MGNDDKARLKALLQYWVEHNQEHRQEIGDWAVKAGALGEAGVAREMTRAAAQMDKASDLLSRALKRLEET